MIIVEAWDTDPVKGVTNLRGRSFNITKDHGTTWELLKLLAYSGYMFMTHDRYLHTDNKADERLHLTY